MKKSFWLVLVSVLFAVVGCQYDDTDLQGKVKDMNDRLTALEQKVADLNTQVNGIQSAIQALQANLYVTNVVVTRDASGAPTKYEITLSDGSTITLLPGIQGEKGDKGDKGDQGPQGDQGEMPAIGVELVDGVYYWTVNGELLTDKDGNYVPVTGPQGEMGPSPKFKIEDGSWWVSYDNEKTWEKVGLVANSETSVVVTEYDEYVELDINGVKVSIPKEKAFTLVFEVRKDLVTPNATIAYPYTIEGVAEGDETEVDVYSIIGNWKAEAVATDNTSGVINVTNVGGGTAKVFVYATNHKGKTDMVSLNFEGGILDATIEVEDIGAEGGFLSLNVEYNLDYEIYIAPEAQSWIHVAPATKASQIQEYVLTVDPNTAPAMRYSLVQVLSKQTGESIKDIDILQYPADGAVTDLSSVVSLPDGKTAVVNQVTVVAASAKNAIITDGQNFSYVASGELEAGAVIDITGVKKTDEYGLAYIESVTVVPVEGVQPVEIDNHENFSYYGFGSSYFYTVTSGELSLENGTYFVPGYAEPQRIVIENPTQELTSLVGKYVSVSGWVKTSYYGKDNDMEDYILTLTDITEVVFAEEAGWEPYYAGMTSGEEGYPEAIGNRVSNPTDDSFYQIVVYNASVLDEFDSTEELIKNVAYNTADDLQFYITYYGLFGLAFDDVFSIFAHNDTYEEAFSELAFGKYVILAVGLDKDARVSGKYAIKEFEKVETSMKISYEDYIGKWSVNGVEWIISEKVKGVSYNIDNIPGSSSMAARGGVTTVEALYDSEKGRLYVQEQELAAYNDPSTNNYGPLKDYFSGVFSYSGSEYPNFPVNGDVATIFSMVGNEDGSFEFRPGTCDFGTFTKARFHWLIQEGELKDRGNKYGELTLPIKGIFPVVKNTGKYEDFLGTWKVGADVWTITEKVAGSTYSVAGIYGHDMLYSGGVDAIEGGFENGHFYLKEQLLGTFNSDEIPAFSNNPYGMCVDSFSGIFEYGSNTYQAYPSNVDTPSVVCEGYFNNNGEVVLWPGSCSYNTFFALGWGWTILEGANAGGGNWYRNYPTNLPATMVKANGNGAPRKAPAAQQSVKATNFVVNPAFEKAVDVPMKTSVEKKERRIHKGQILSKSVR